jgi:hypothetical protein
MLILQFFGQEISPTSSATKLQYLWSKSYMCDLIEKIYSHTDEEVMMQYESVLARLASMPVPNRTKVLYSMYLLLNILIGSIEDENVLKYHLLENYELMHNDQKNIDPLAVFM